MTFEDIVAAEHDALAERITEGEDTTGYYRRRWDVKVSVKHEWKVYELPSINPPDWADTPEEHHARAWEHFQAYVRFEKEPPFWFKSESIEQF